MVHKLFTDFFNSERTGGFILIACTTVSIILANSGWSEQFLHMWHFLLAGKPIEFWINDGLMAIFFLMIGLELEREIYRGELSSLKAASLPAIAALGGMILPASIYILINFRTGDFAGTGIPMATDIAFSLGILSMLGKRIPLSLTIFLTALAVIDDLGAILLIAFFYTVHFDVVSLAIAISIFGILLVMNRLKINCLIPYLAGGVILWYFMYRSGVHATVSGVLLAFTIPFSGGGEDSPSYRLQHLLHKPVAFIILPLFALANTGILVSGQWMSDLIQPYSLGIILGLIIGKPVGILLFSLFAVKTGISSLPADLSWKHILGVGLLAGIGFTMSIFITILAFNNPQIITGAKIAILGTSLLAGIAGYLVLLFTSRT